MVISKTYNEQVTVFAESGELLGSAQLVGGADQSSRGGLWGWRAQLLDTSFAPGVLLQAGELRIQFKDRTVERAFCQRVRYRNASPSIHLIGNGMPPGVDIEGFPFGIANQPDQRFLGKIDRSRGNGLGEFAPVAAKIVSIRHSL